MNARVKSVLSGDTLVLTPVNAAPSDSNERLLSLAYVTAPRFNSNDAFGYESREYLRNLLVGKPVQFKVLYTNNNREYGDVSAPIFSSLVERALADGSVKLRDDAPVKQGYADYAGRLDKAQLAGQTARKIVWANSHLNLRQVGSPPEELYGSGRQIPSIVEKVVSGDRVQLRTLMDKDFHYIGPALLAGIRAPRTAYGDSAGDPFGEAAKALVVTRLLQRAVRAVYVAPAPANPQLPLVTLVHPAGDIAVALLEAGLATVADAHAPLVGSERMLVLRAAQRKAEQAGVNLWKKKEVKPSAKAIEATVVKVISADTVVVASDAIPGGEKTVQLSSIRAPKKSNAEQAPFLAAAKEFARALLIGKQVAVHVDAVRPASDQFEERELVTLALTSVNAAVEIVGAGYASVIRHRRDDTDKSPFIDELFAAEADAQSAKKGMWGAPPKAGSRIVDASESVVRARGFMASLERRGKIPGVVERVFSGGRLRVAVPSENCVLTAVLGGVRVPRPTEDHGDKAYEFTTRRYLQRNVQLVVHNVDKTGAFISNVYLAGKPQSLQVQLALEGLADVHGASANAAGLRQELDTAKETAQTELKGLWENYVPEPEPESEEEEDEEPSVSAGSASAGSAGSAGSATALGAYEDAYCTRVSTDAFAYQLLANHQRHAQLQTEMASFYNAATNSGVRFPKPPRRGEFVVIKTPSGYLRGRTTAFAGTTYTVDQFDLGTEVEVPAADLRPLQAQFATTAVPALAVAAKLAYIAKPPSNYVSDFNTYIQGQILDKKIVVQAGPGGVTVFTEDSKAATDSVNTRLIDDGYTSVGAGPDSDMKQRLAGLERDAMRERIGMWEYGDSRDDEQ